MWFEGNKSFIRSNKQTGKNAAIGIQGKEDAMLELVGRKIEG